MYMDVPDKPITVSPEQYKRYKIILLVGALIGVIGIAGGIYGIVSYNAMRQQEELHEQQLELLRSKTTTLQEKMDKMDSLDQELRQMVKGAGTGESPKGEGSVAGKKNTVKIYLKPGIMSCCTPRHGWKQRAMPELSASLR